MEQWSKGVLDDTNELPFPSFQCSNNPFQITLI